jgi:RNA polymerase sigma-70 factor, ECF subfamily
MLDVRRILYSFTTNMVSLGRTPDASTIVQRGGSAPSSPSSQRDDEMALVRAIVRGDTDAFDTFYERYVDRLYQMIHYHLGSVQADAEDILQETMIAAMNALPRFRGEARLFTWLCAIAQHKITDHRRRGGSSGERIAVSLDDTRSVADSYGDTQGMELRLLVREALAGLPDAHRQVLLLKYVQGLSVDEIAVITGRSFKSVESLLSRARDGLREALGQESDHAS